MSKIPPVYEAVQSHFAIPGRLCAAIVLAIAMIVTANRPAAAQTVDQGQRILNEREAEALRKRAEKGPTGLDLPAAQIQKPAVEEQCFAIRKIDVKGATLLGPGQVDGLVKQFSKKCMGTAAINALLQAINAAYIELGYVTSRAMIPEQDLTSGVLQVAVVEAKVEAFDYREIRDGKEVPGDVRKISNAFPGVEGDVLQLRDVEQGLDQINRLQSNKAALDIQPGLKPGGSTLVVRNKIEDQIRGQVRSIITTGRNRHIAKGEAIVEADDLLNLSDNWYLAYSGGNTSNSLSFAASIPYGYWLFNASASYSESLDQLTATSDLFNRSAGGTLGAERLVYRDSKRKWKLGGSFTHRWSERWINSTGLQPQRLTVAGFSSIYEQHLPGAFVSLNAGVDVGLRALGVAADGQALEGAPQSAFTKMRASGLYYGGWETGMTLMSRVSAQQSVVPLYSTEQLQIGGPETVRGFEFSPVIGDRGIYVQNTLSLPFSMAFGDRKAFVQAAGTAASYWDAVTPYVFADAGIVESEANADTFSMIGAGAGLRLSTEWVSADLYAAFPIGEWGDFDAPDFEVRLAVTVKTF